MPHPQPTSSPPTPARPPSALRALPVAAVLLLGLAPLAPARADEAADSHAAALDPAKKAEARRHFDLAVRLFDDGNYGAALAEFEAAEAGYPRPEFRYNIGLTLKRLFRYPEAIDHLQGYLRAPGVPARRRAEVQALVREMETSLADVELAITPEGAEVAVDGAAPRRLGARLRLLSGPHVIEVQAPDHRGARRDITVVSGRPQRLEIALQPIPRTAAITITTRPEGAGVRVDGADLGAAPVTIELPAGSHQLLVETPGFTPYRGDLVAIPGQSRTVPVELAALDPALHGPPGTLRYAVQGRHESDRYTVFSGTQSCSTPCMLWLRPGPQTLAVTGDARYQATVDIPGEGASLRVRRVSKASYIAGGILGGAAVLLGALAAPLTAARGDTLGEGLSLFVGISAAVVAVPLLAKGGRNVIEVTPRPLGALPPSPARPFALALAPIVLSGGGGATLQLRF